MRAHFLLSVVSLSLSFSLSPPLPLPSTPLPSLSSTPLSLPLPLPLSFPPPHSTTMIQLLRLYCHKKQMDSSQYIISLPPDSAHPPVKPSTTAGSLKTKDIQVVRKGTKPPSSAPPPVPPTTTPPTESTDGGKLGPFEQVRLYYLTTSGVGGHV